MSNLKKGNKGFLQGLRENIEEQKKNDSPNDNPVLDSINSFEKGFNITKEIMSGSKIKTPRLLVDPNQCRIWDRHNRHFELLNESRCKDLIDQFKVTGKQEFPGIVRMVQGEGDVRYEIICGARRFWTCKFLGWKYFVEIRDISDEEAFRLSDIENRAREDISDYERAMDYKNALEHYYENQIQMASRLEVTTSWLSRYLDLADLPEEIIKAYRSITEIKALHARRLKPFLAKTKANKSNLDKILAKAVELQGKDIDGTKVINELLSVVKNNKNIESEYTSKNGLLKVKIKKQNNRKFQITVDSNDESDFSEIIDLISQALKSF